MTDKPTLLTRQEAAEYLRMLRSSGATGYWSTSSPPRQLTIADLERYVADCEARVDALVDGIVRVMQGRPLLPPERKGEDS